MYTNTQIFFNNFTAGRTNLSRVFRIHFNQLSTSFFRFVRKEIKELRPRCIVYVFIQGSKVIFNHLFGFQIFDEDKSKFINYFPAKFMLEIFTLIADFFMQTGEFLFQIFVSFFRISTLSFVSDCFKYLGLLII